MEVIFKVTPPEEYKAFLYKVTIHSNKTMKFYGGSKKGMFTETYYGSPETNKEQYLSDLSKFPSTMEILNIGKYVDVLTEERKMLLETNAETNPEWFNASNLSGHQTTGFNPHLDYVRNKIDNRDYRMGKLPKQEVYAIAKFQVRDKEYIPGKCTDLLQKMNDTQGRYCFEQNEEYPVIVLEDWFGKGKDYRIDGAHMTKAAQSCKFVKDLHILWISREDNKLLKESDIHTLGLSLNPQFEILRDPSSESESINWLANRKRTQNIGIKNQSNRDELKVWGWSGQKITSFMRSAEERIKKDKDLAPGEYIHDYSQGTSAATLKRKREQATTETCGVIVTKSGMPKNVWKEIMVNITDSQEKTHWRIWVWHDSVNNRDTWQEKYNREYKRIAKCISDNWMSDMRIEFSELEFTYFDEMKMQLDD